jgi:hypothetical protein
VTSTSRGERESEPRDELSEVTLVDADPSPDDPEELVASALAGIRPETSAGVDMSTLSLSPASLGAARAVRQAFEAVTDCDPAEGLLEQLLVGEVGIAHELQSLEAATTVLLTRTLDNPRLALEVAKVAREIVGLSSAIRRRTEGSLGAIAGLRAQRVLLARHRLGI